MVKVLLELNLIVSRTFQIIKITCAMTTEKVFSVANAKKITQFTIMTIFSIVALKRIVPGDG